MRGSRGRRHMSQKWLTSASAPTDSEHNPEIWLLFGISHADAVGDLWINKTQKSQVRFIDSEEVHFALQSCLSKKKRLVPLSFPFLRFREPDFDPALKVAERPPCYSLRRSAIVGILLALKLPPWHARSTTKLGATACFRGPWRHFSCSRPGRACRGPAATPRDAKPATPNCLSTGCQSMSAHRFFCSPDSTTEETT